MRRISCVAATLILVALAACSDDDKEGKEACDALTAKCAGTQVACDAAKIDGSSDPDKVEDCIENAVDCNAAQACLQGI